MNQFNKKKDRLLIQLVKNYPVLYDPSNANFKNCIVKHKVWECISNSMQIPITDIKRRWKHFRDHYQKKLKAEQAGLKSLHTWEYKSYLSFLTEFSNHKEKAKEESDPDDPVETEAEVFSPDSIPVQSVLNDDILDIETPEMEQIDQIEIPRKKRKKMDTLAAVVESRLAERFRFETTKERSPTHKFFDSMADIVAEFPPHLVAEARLKVCQTVNEIEMKKHSELQFM